MLAVKVLALAQADDRHDLPNVVADYLTMMWARIDENVLDDVVAELIASDYSSQHETIIEIVKMIYCR